MVEMPATQVWIGRGIYVGLCFLIIFFQLLPLDSRPQVFPWPDLLLVVTLVWVARRPDYAPMLAIALIFFLTDMLFQRPPGLSAALVLILTEVIRKRSAQFRKSSVILEWMAVAGGMIALTLAYRLILIVSMTPAPPLGLSLLQLIMSVLAYPLVVIVAHFAFRVSRPAQGAVDSLGHRL